MQKLKCSNDHASMSRMQQKRMLQSWNKGKQLPMVIKSSSVPKQVQAGSDSSSESSVEFSEDEADRSEEIEQVVPDPENSMQDESFMPAVEKISVASIRCSYLSRTRLHEKMKMERSLKRHPSRKTKKRREKAKQRILATEDVKVPHDDTLKLDNSDLNYEQYCCNIDYQNSLVVRIRDALRASRLVQLRMTYDGCNTTISDARLLLQQISMDTSMYCDPGRLSMPEFSEGIATLSLCAKEIL